MSGVPDVTSRGLYIVHVIVVYQYDVGEPEIKINVLFSLGKRSDTQPSMAKFDLLYQSYIGVEFSDIILYVDCSRFISVIWALKEDFLKSSNVSSQSNALPKRFCVRLFAETFLF